MSKMEDAILGFAIGDALGVPYEFNKRDTFPCADMIGYGTHHKPAGTWSDDTSMTLATLDSLKAHGGKIVTGRLYSYVYPLRKRYDWETAAKGYQV
jgi:ADP-ribosylglycohydrolase